MTSAVKPLVLLAGEKSFVGLLKYIVEKEGFNSLLTDNLGEAISLSEIEQPDLIVLDAVSLNGSALAAREKIYENLKTRHTPVLMLVADSFRPEDLVQRYAESTDYIWKPFSPDAFTGRLHDLLRHSSSAAGAGVLRYADIVMELGVHRVYRNQRSIHLGPVEYRILQRFLKSPRKVLSRDEILASVRGNSAYVAPRSVDVHVSRIRKALCEHGEPNYIRTVRGVGYSLDTECDGPAADTV